MRISIDCNEATKKQYGFDEKITAVGVDTDELFLSDNGLENTATITIEIENNRERKILCDRKELLTLAEFIINTCG